MKGITWWWLAFGTAALAPAQEYARIPPGAFEMGCESGYPCAVSLPKKRVEFLQPLWMTKTEVTVKQFRAFVKATGYRTDAEKAHDARTWRSPGFPLSIRQPAVYLSLNDANAYCTWTGARVPFEAEWEYAARAGTTTHHYWGEEIDGRYLWYFENTRAKPGPVGRKLPNAWGLYDVEGNAWEWTKGGGPHTSVTKPGWGTIRGGSWITCPEPYPPKEGRRQRTIGLSVAFEEFKDGNFPPGYRRYDTGIRCAK
jgi:formylglycine-generating enzyme required for sulfatase activity